MRLKSHDFHGIPTAQGNKAIDVFQTGFTGSTGCVLSFNLVIYSIMEKPQIQLPLAELSACYAQGRAGRIKEPQMNMDIACEICVHLRLSAVRYSLKDQK